MELSESHREVPPDGFFRITLDLVAICFLLLV